MTEPTPSLRSDLDAVRAHDRPADVDREALLQKILADVRPAPAPSHTPRALLGAGALALVLTGVGAWRAARSAPPAGANAPRHDVGPQSQRANAPRHDVGAQSQPANAIRHTVAPRAAAVAGDEWAMLREADGALQAHDPDRALRVLARHAAEHPRGVAGPEVLAYRVRAWCMVGRVDEAERIAAQLRALAPDSPAAYSLRATCVPRR